MDRHSDTCKLVLCCEDDEDILELVKNRFKVIEVDAPETHEVSIQILSRTKSDHYIDLVVITCRQRYF